MPANTPLFVGICFLYIIKTEMMLMLQLSGLKKYIVDELKIAPQNLLCKNKIIKSDYIIATICSEEIFFRKIVKY